MSSDAVPGPRFVWNSVGCRVESFGSAATNTADAAFPENSSAAGWQNWDPLAEMWINNVQQGPDLVCREFMVTRPLLKLAGPLESKRVLDAGCGEGFYSRRMADEGALVTGVDSSAKLVEAACAQDTGRTNRSEFQVASLTDLSELGQFDIVVCNQVLNMVPDLPNVFRQFSSVLPVGGRLIISIAHPCFDGVGAGWGHRPNGHMVWTKSRYGQQVSGRASHGAPAFHRPISAYISAARAAGFLLSDLVEPVVPDDAFAALNWQDYAFVDQPANLFFQFVRQAETELTES